MNPNPQKDSQIALDVTLIKPLSIQFCSPLDEQKSLFIKSIAFIPRRDKTD